MWIVGTHEIKAARRRFVSVWSTNMTDRVSGGLECIKSHNIAKYLVDGNC